MKTILITIALLIGLSIQAQEMARLSGWTEFNSDGTVERSFECLYDEYDELKIINDRITDDDIFQTYNYDNDTMYERFNYVYSTITYYEYTDDTVFLIKDGDTTHMYNIDEEYQIIQGGYYQWENGNVISSEDGWTATYQEYRNPWLFAQLYLKGTWWVSGISNGSYNLLDKATSTNGYEHTMEVVESIDDKWPLKILLKSNGDLEKSFVVEYHDWITDTPEIPARPYTVLSINYYDLMGREIQKPKQGFYIERKTTDKGVISKKYFIQKN